MHIHSSGHLRMPHRQISNSQTKRVKDYDRVHMMPVNFENSEKGGGQLSR